MEDQNSEEKNLELPGKNSKKKYLRNRIKITDIKSARSFLSKLIFDCQSGDMPSSYYKDLTYMVQVYISTEKIIKKEDDIISLLLREYQSAEYMAGVQMKTFITMAKKYFDPKGVEVLEKLYKRLTETRFEEYLEKKETLGDKIDRIKKDNSNHSNMSLDEWKLMTLKQSSIELPEKALEELLTFITENKAKKKKRK